jgi:hypothetical protein
MRRPLDPAFSSGAESPAVRNGRAKGVALVGLLLAGLAGTGTVFAANVGINGGSGISYSQGTEVVAACDPDGIGVDLDFAFASNNLWVLAKYRQMLTGIHRDCFSVANGEKRTLKLSFYEGTTEQVYISGSMPVRTNLTSDNNTLIFAGTGLLADAQKNLDVMNAACTPVPTSSLTTLCGLDYNTSNTSLSSPSTVRQSFQQWRNGCAAIPNQPTSPTNKCFAWHVAASSDRIVIEIE